MKYIKSTKNIKMIINYKTPIYKKPIPHNNNYIKLHLIYNYIQNRLT